MNLLGQPVSAKKILKEVLLLGGPADACRITVEINKKRVTVIDDYGIKHQYNQASISTDQGTHLFYLHNSLEDNSIIKILIRGYKES